MQHIKRSLIVILQGLVMLTASTWGGVAQAATYTITDLGTLGGSPFFSPLPQSYGINAAGQVVGGTLTATWARHAFLSSNGVMTDLGTLPLGTLPVGYWDTAATGINNAGQVVGTSYTSTSYSRHAFLYSNGVMTDLGSLSGGSGESFATGINNAGQVVGYSWSNSIHAFLYSNGVMTDLGGFPGSWRSQATGINDAGQVAGWSGIHGYYLPFCTARAS